MSDNLDFYQKVINYTPTELDVYMKANYSKNDVIIDMMDKYKILLINDIEKFIIVTSVIFDTDKLQRRLLDMIFTDHLRKTLDVGFIAIFNENFQKLNETFNFTADFKIKYYFLTNDIHKLTECFKQSINNIETVETNFQKKIDSIASLLLSFVVFYNRINIFPLLIEQREKYNKLVPLEYYHDFNTIISDHINITSYNSNLYTEIFTNYCFLIKEIGIKKVSLRRDQYYDHPEGFKTKFCNIFTHAYNHLNNRVASRDFFMDAQHQVFIRKLNTFANIKNTSIFSRMQSSDIFAIRNDTDMSKEDKICVINKINAWKYNYRPLMINSFNRDIKNVKEYLQNLIYFGCTTYLFGDVTKNKNSINRNRIILSDKPEDYNGWKKIIFEDAGIYNYYVLCTVNFTDTTTIKKCLNYINMRYLSYLSRMKEKAHLPEDMLIVYTTFKFLSRFNHFLILLDNIIIYPELSESYLKDFRLRNQNDIIGLYASYIEKRNTETLVAIAKVTEDYIRMLNITYYQID